MAEYKHGNKNSRLQVMSVYLPTKGSKNHVTEFQECIDEIYELIQKYGNIHKILIEGDLGSKGSFISTPLPT
jgi:hypothetical protein